MRFRNGMGKANLRAAVVSAALLLIFSVSFAARNNAQADALAAEIDLRAAQVEDKVVSWRRDIHEHPELSNREFRTAKLAADHLTALGLEVRTGVAHTGVIGVLRGGKPGPCVALRADMDALPVVEQTGLPFASKVKAEYNGQEVGVMHACGHDAHTAILMGVAEVRLSDSLPVTVNDPALVARMVPTLERVAGKDKVNLSPPKTGADDFAFFAERIPGFYIFLGCRTSGADPATVAPNHSPFFTVDESALPLGVRALANLAVDYLKNSPGIFLNIKVQQLHASNGGT